MTIKKIHRVLGLCAAVLWLVQILSGVLLTFRQELDSATLPGGFVPVQTAALGERIHSIEHSGGHVASLWVTNFSADRFDVFYVDSSAAERLMRIDGAGRVLRDGLEHATFANGGFFRTLTLVHTSLLAGDFGEWVIAVSGILLFSNIILGLKLAWPRPGTWRRSLILQRTRPGAPRFYSIHRTFGLWIAFPLLLIVAAGVALRFDDSIESALGVARVLPVGAPAGLTITPTQALDTVLARYPGSTLTALSMPTSDGAWYRVRVRARGEVPRMYGTTTVYVSAANGTVLRDYPARADSPARTFYDAIYPFHTAELGAVPGRLLLLTLGLLLLVMGVFGIRLWLAKARWSGA